jgi:hypothetical protein
VGIVRERLRSFLLRLMIDPERGEGARLAFVDGKSESRGEPDGGAGDVTLR